MAEPDWFNDYFGDAAPDGMLESDYRALSSNGKAVVKAIHRRFTIALHDGTLYRPGVLDNGLSVEDNCVIMGISDGLPAHADGKRFMSEEAKQVADVARALWLAANRSGVVQGPVRPQSSGCASMLALLVLLGLGVVYLAG